MRDLTDWWWWDVTAFSTRKLKAATRKLKADEERAIRGAFTVVGLCFCFVPYRPLPRPWEGFMDELNILEATLEAMRRSVADVRAQLQAAPQGKVRRLEDMS